MTTTAKHIISEAFSYLIDAAGFLFAIGGLYIILLYAAG